MHEVKDRQALAFWQAVACNNLVSCIFLQEIVPLIIIIIILMTTDNENKIKETQEKSQLYNKTSKENVKYFYTILDFPQFKILEDNYLEIIEELKQIVKTDKKSKQHSVFEPWVEKNLYQESNEDGWDVAPLMIGGEKIPERCERFPFLMGLMNQLEGIMSISFSLLKAGTHIVPHKGYDDYSEKVYRYHLGLIVPKGEIAIRVEKDIMKWEEGKSFVFDDFMIHEAWNFTNQDRLVLIIDFLKENATNGVKFIDTNFNNSIKGYLNK